MLSEFLEQTLTAGATAAAAPVMSVLPYVVAAWVVLVGLYGIVTSRNLLHLVICLVGRCSRRPTCCCSRSATRRTRGAGVRRPPAEHAGGRPGRPGADAHRRRRRHDGDGAAAGARGAGAQALRHARPATSSAASAGGWHGRPRAASPSPIPLLAAAVLVGAAAMLAAAGRRRRGLAGGARVRGRRAVRCSCCGRRATARSSTGSAAGRRATASAIGDRVRRSTRSAPGWPLFVALMFVVAFVFSWRYFVSSGRSSTP